MVVFLIVFGIIIVCIIAGTIAGVLLYKRSQKIKAEQKAYVKEHSIKLSAIKETNKSYKFSNPKDRKLVCHFFLNTRKDFDTFDSESAIRSTFYDKQTQIQALMSKATKDKESYRRYQEEIKNLPVTIYSDLPPYKYMNSDLFYKLEEEYISREVQTVNTDAFVIIVWSYDTPKGRYHYEDRIKLGYDKIVKRYFNYFNVDLRKAEENEKRMMAVKNITSILTKNIYKYSEVANLYKEYGIEPTKALVETTLFNAGYLPRKDSEFYIRASIKNARDLILTSADNNGLIVYDNAMKDDEYDSGIEKLQREGRIVPISNLLFLKVSKTLSYKGVTLETIDEFESLLLKYSRKNEFISLKQIIENIDCLVTRIDFEECFVRSLVKYCGFLFEIPGLENMFSTVQKPQRIMFLEWLLKDKKSVDAFDLIYDLKEMYGVEYNIYSILYDIEKNKTKLYYNPEMEKIYSDKKYFFEELEDVL